VANKLEQAITMIKKERLKLSYQDWCVVFKMQAMQGLFYHALPYLGSFKGSHLLRFWLDKHSHDLNFIMAAIFSGYETYMVEGYEHLYYNLAKTRSARHPYFKQNSIDFYGQLLPYHVVHAAIRAEIPESLYANTGSLSDSYVTPGKLGFPRVWAFYSWSDFVRQYKQTFNKFLAEHQRELTPADILISALSQSNRFHGLKLLDPDECPILKNWIQALPETSRKKIDDFKKAQWIKIEDPESDE
jgi:hypothetical protein